MFLMFIECLLRSVFVCNCNVTEFFMDFYVLLLRPSQLDRVHVHMLIGGNANGDILIQDL